MRVIQADESGATLVVTKNELMTLTGALNEVCHGPEAIEEWEFHTRMGVERAEAQALLSEISAAAD